MEEKKDTAEQVATERINLLVEYVCSVYGISYHELADIIGRNRGWFTRALNGGFEAWHYEDAVKLCRLAANVDDKRLFHWLIEEYDNEILRRRNERIDEEPVKTEDVK